MKRLLLVLAIFLISGQAIASDQKLAHGAGTLPHLTRAFTLSLGLEFPTPVLYALQYDIGLGNRVQLGFSASVLLAAAIEINSMFNVLKTANDSDFLSLYFNPGIYIVLFYGVFVTPTLRTGIAYEHRFGDNRRFGLYTKIGVLMVQYDDVPTLELDWRVGFQALRSKRFSITLEPMLRWSPYYPLLLPGGKVALTWAFESKRKPRPKHP